MSEFLSSCPKCRQRILCDTVYIGRRVACPLCMQEIEMPATPCENQSATSAPNPGASGSPVPGAPAGRRAIPAVAMVAGIAVLITSGVAIGMLKSKHSNPVLAASPGAPMAMIITTRPTMAPGPRPDTASGTAMR
jgi:hypothetical protein